MVLGGQKMAVSYQVSYQVCTNTTVGRVVEEQPGTKNTPNHELTVTQNRTYIFTVVDIKENLPLISQHKIP
jgi:hypothetical protein